MGHSCSKQHRPLFYHHADHAVYYKFISSGLAPENTPAEEILRALTRLDAMTSSATELFVKRARRGDCRSKAYAKARAKILRRTPHQLIPSARQFAPQNYREKFKVDNESELIKVRVKLVFNMLHTATVIFIIFLLSSSFLTIPAEQLNTYVCKTLKDIREW